MDEEPKFPLMAKVRVLPPHPLDEGYVIAFRMLENGQRVYKLSLEDAGGSWENWIPEQHLERC